MASRDEFEQANQRAKDLEARIPRVVSAHYDRKTGRIVIHLSSKLIVSFSNRKPGLTKAETFAHLVAVVLRVRARITWPHGAASPDGEPAFWPPWRSPGVPA